VLSPAFLHVLPCSILRFTGLVLGEVCSALGNALVAPHSLIVQTGAAACLVSLSAKMEGTKVWATATFPATFPLEQSPQRSVS